MVLVTRDGLPVNGPISRAAGFFVNRQTVSPITDRRVVADHVTRVTALDDEQAGEPVRGARVARRAVDEPAVQYRIRAEQLLGGHRYFIVLTGPGPDKIGDLCDRVARPGVIRLDVLGFEVRPPLREDPSQQPHRQQRRGHGHGELAVAKAHNVVSCPWSVVRRRWSLHGPRTTDDGLLHAYCDAS